MSKLLRRPTAQIDVNAQGRFEKFNLKENPFPSQPVVNKDSADKRYNGDIFEMAIRQKEYDQIKTCFLRQAQSNLNHLRLGYIIEFSYTGRGNGKSAFAVNLQQDINRDFCLDISDDVNKCFAIYVTPEPGGQTKTFGSFVDLIFKAIIDSNVIRYCLATLRLEAIAELYPDLDLDDYDEKELVDALNTEAWLAENSLDHNQILKHIYKNEYLQDLPPSFPIYKNRWVIDRHFVTQDDFISKYKSDFRKNSEQSEFVFSHLVRLFQAAGFNGCYVLVDDFERITEFQTTRQKKDFALELRTCLFDGLYLSAKLGFYNFLLILHAGVQRSISDAWAESGMENRSPISPPTATNQHIIRFENLGKEHASLLIKKYLAEYRISPNSHDGLLPFTEGAISKIGELTEYNAGKILKMAYELVDKAANLEEYRIIDEAFVSDNKGVREDATDKNISSIENAQSVDLMDKAGGNE